MQLFKLGDYEKEKKMQKIRKFIISLLIISLSFSLIPVNAFAADTVDAETVVEVETDVENDVEAEETEQVEIEETIEDDDPGAGRLAGNIPEGFYDESQMTRVMPGASDSIVHNAKFDGYTLEQGVDVSSWQGEIDWEKVKAAGIDFAIIRVGYRGYGAAGNLSYDTYAVKNIKGAIAAGIPVGVYIFSQAINTQEAIEEADYIVSKIRAYDITLPVVFDYEYYQTGKGRLWDAHLSVTAATNVCKAFCERVASYGYAPMVYANKSFLESVIDGNALAEKYPIWLANYTSQTKYAGEYEYWQYTSSGKVDGISGNTDLNFRYVKEDKTKGAQVSITGTGLDWAALKWTIVDDAEGYEIERAGSDGNYTLIGKVEGTQENTYKDTGLSQGTSYKYRVRSYKKAEDGTVEYAEYGNIATAVTTIPTTTLKGQATAFDTIKLTWNKVEGASGYQIQRYNSSSKSYETIRTLEGGSTVSYVNGSRTAATTYKYRIRAYKKVNSQTVYSAYTNEVSIKTKNAVTGKVTASNVTVRTGAGTSYKKLTTAQKNKSVKVTATTGSWYKISISVSGKTKTGYIAKKYVLLPPGGTTLTVNASSFDKVKLTWNKVSGASGYQIQRYNSSKKSYTTVATVSGESKVSYTNGSLNANTAYKYRVCAYKKSGTTVVCGSYTDVKTVKTQAAKAGVINANNTKLRKGASTSYSILKRVNKGTKVQVTGSKGGWYRVSVKINGKNKTAYVVKKYVKFS